MIGLVLGAVLASAPCHHDREALLSMPVEAFDKTYGQGWRPLGDVPVCERVAADLISAYRERNGDRLSRDERNGLAWHEGQLRAASGEEARAAALLELARSGDEDEGDRLYAEATVAFLRRDRLRLTEARRRLAAMPEPAGFAAAAARAKAKHGMVVTWPPNLGVVDGLIACFGRPYREAYAAECRPKP